MRATWKSHRQTISLPARVAKRVKSLSKIGNVSANRVLVGLIESGLESKGRERERFFALADRLADSKNRAERDHLKKELARMTFGG